MVFNGENLKKVRHKRGYTQKQLADIMGVSQAMITQYETNKRSPKLKTVQHFAHVLKVDFTAFYDESTPLTKDDMYRAELSDAISLIKGLGLSVKVVGNNSDYNIYVDIYDNGKSYFDYTLTEESLLAFSDKTRKSAYLTIMEKSIENKDNQIIKPRPQADIDTSVLNETGIQKVQEYIHDISLIEKYTK